MDAKTAIAALIANIEKVFIGKTEVVKTALVGLLSNGHVLIEDIPGVGKTTLARALALSIDCKFARIQFTPDLLPSDIIGVSVYHTEKNEFHFKPGPIFANVLLADEINRTTPRTQSSLLEAMNDFAVTVDGCEHKLDLPFLVLATQNPYEFEGTYPLPESQLDRFLLRTEIGYPSAENEKKVIDSQRLRHPIDSLEAVTNKSEILALQKAVKEVRFDDSLVDYALSLTRATRKIDHLEVGVSPRGSLHLYRASQAAALIEGRDYVIPDDVKKTAVPVLSHRLISRTGSYGVSGTANREVIEEILENTTVPL